MKWIMGIAIISVSLAAAGRCCAQELTFSYAASLDDGRGGKQAVVFEGEVMKGGVVGRAYVGANELLLGGRIDAGGTVAGLLLLPNGLKLGTFEMRPTGNGLEVHYDVAGRTGFLKAPAGVAGGLCRSFAVDADL